MAPSAIAQTNQVVQAALSEQNLHIQKLLDDHLKNNADQTSKAIKSAVSEALGATADRFDKLILSMQSQIRAEIDAKLAPIFAKLNDWPMSDAASSNGRQDRPGVKRFRFGPDSETNASSGGRPATNKCKIWATGFTRKFLKATLEKHWEHILKKNDHAALQAGKFFAYNFAKGYCIDFPTHDIALEAVELLRKLEPKFFDPRKNEERTIRFRFDRSIEERHQGRIMGEIWKKTQAHLEATNQLKEGIRFGTSGKPASFFVIVHDDPWELITLGRAMNNDATLSDASIDKDNCAKFNITVDQAEKWITDAIAYANSFRS